MPDIRPFTSVLRGVCFHPTNQRATLNVNKAGLIVYVEEARTTRSEEYQYLFTKPLLSSFLTVAAYIRRELFEEFEFNAIEQDTEDTQVDSSTMLSFQLSTLLECLNIFGTATGSSSGSNVSRQPWQREDSDNEGQAGAEAQNGGRHAQNQTRPNRRIDSFFPRSDGKGTGMRVSYAGQGHPIVLLL